MVAQAANAKKPAPKLTIPLLTKLKVRNLYLSQGLGPQAIAKITGLTEKQAGNIIVREGLAKLRASAKSAIEARSDARTQEQVSEVIEAIARESEEIALSGIARAREATESRSEFAAKDFQSWTGGVRNLVNIARQARGLDSERSAGQGATLNVFVGRFETVGDKAPKNVTGNAGSDTPKAIDV